MLSDDFLTELWQADDTRHQLSILGQKLPGNCSLETAKNGLPTLICDRRYEHSKYDPLREAKRKTGPQAGHAAAAVFKSGLGYAALTWLSRFPERPLLIIEEREALNNFNAFLLRRFFPDSPWQLSRQADRATVFSFLEKIPGREIRSLLLVNPQSAPQDFQRLFREFMSNMFTEMEFEKLWFRNILINSATLARHDCRWLQLKADFPAGQTAVLAGAGPTLANSLGLLRQLQDRALIFAVDTACPVLVKSGITPDFIVSLDGQIHNLHDFAGLDLSASTLLCDISVYHTIPTLNFARVCFFETANFAEENGQQVLISNPLVLWLKQFCGEIGPVRCGGNVTTSAVDILLQLPVQRVFLAGCDHAYVDNKLHCNGTPSQERLLNQNTREAGMEAATFRAISRRHLEYCRDYRGRQIISDQVLGRYAAWMDAAIRETPREQAWYTLSAGSRALNSVAPIDDPFRATLFPDGTETGTSAKALLKPGHAGKESGSPDWQASFREALHRLGQELDLFLEGQDELDPADAAAFFERHTYLRRVYSAQLLHLQGEGKDKTDTLLREMYTQLRRTRRYISRLEQQAASHTAQSRSQST